MNQRIPAAARIKTPTPVTTHLRMFEGTASRERLVRPSGSSLVRRAAALTSIAETAGKLTVAECVEDASMLLTLYECGVDMAQGYIVGMPRLHLPKSLPTLGTNLFQDQAQLSGI